MYEGSGSFDVGRLGCLLFLSSRAAVPAPAPISGLRRRLLVDRAAGIPCFTGRMPLTTCSVSLLGKTTSTSSTRLQALLIGIGWMVGKSSTRLPSEAWYVFQIAGRVTDDSASSMNTSCNHARNLCGSPSLQIDLKSVSGNGYSSS